MLEHWLNTKSLVQKTSVAPDTIGDKIRYFDPQNQDDLSDIRLAILGLDESADKVRAYLYHYVFSFPEASLMDLGNVRKNTPDFIIPLLKELQEGGITPILIGEDVALLWSIYQAYQDTASNTNLVVFDEKIDLKKHLEKFLALEKKAFSNFYLLGHQAHLVTPTTQRLCENKGIDLVRLGKIRNHTEEAEPYLRYADIVQFCLPILKAAEIADQSDVALSGLSIEEACQIAHYAGLSDRLSTISFNGYTLSKSKNAPTPKAIAQLIWYFIDGFSRRNSDFPLTTTQMTQYIVDFKNSSEQLLFWKSNRSGRWWIEVQAIVEEKLQTKLLPCSYKDYEIACEGELSERLSRFFY